MSTIVILSSKFNVKNQEKCLLLKMQKKNQKRMLREENKKLQILKFFVRGLTIDLFTSCGISDVLRRIQLPRINHLADFSNFCVKSCNLLNIDLLTRGKSEVEVNMIQPRPKKILCFTFCILYLYITKTYWEEPTLNHLITPVDFLKVFY